MNFEFRHRVELEGEYVGAIFETSNNLWFYRPLETSKKLNKTRKWSNKKDSAMYYSLEDLMEIL